MRRARLEAAASTGVALRRCASAAGRARHLGIAATLALGLYAGPGRAQESPQSAPAPVPLERLFKLPQDVDLGAGAVRRGGSTRAEWRGRLEAARSGLAQARARLEEAREKLEGLSSDQAWSMSAPGLGGGQAQAPAESSLDYGLRQELRRQREAVASAERRLQDLEIEANLAGVPPDWIAAEPPEAAAEQPAGAAAP